MDDDLEAIVWKAKVVRATLSRSWRYFEHEETCEDIFPYNFEIALSFIEEVEATMEEEVAVRNIRRKQLSLRKL